MTGPAGGVQTSERLGCAGGPPLRLRRQKLLQPSVEAAWQALGERRECARGDGELAHPFRGGRGRAVDEVVDHRPQRVEVGAPGRRAVGEQLGREVRERPAQRRARGEIPLPQGQTEVHDHEPAAELGVPPHEEVSRLEVAVDQIEVVEERQRAERLHREVHEDDRPLAPHGLLDRGPLDELEREAELAGPGLELLDLDEARVVEAGEGRELPAEGLLVLATDGGQLLHRQAAAGTLTVLHQPDASRPAFSQHPPPHVAVAGHARHFPGRRPAWKQENRPPCLNAETLGAKAPPSRQPALRTEFASWTGANVSSVRHGRAEPAPFPRGRNPHRWNEVRVSRRPGAGVVRPLRSRGRVRAKREGRHAREAPAAGPAPDPAGDDDRDRPVLFRGASHRGRGRADLRHGARRPHLPAPRRRAAARRGG